MDKIKEIEVETIQGLEVHVIIDKGNDEFESMPKAVYEERLAAQAEEGGTL